MQITRIAVPDGILSAEHHGDMDRPMDIVFLHANGMNAATYRHVFALLPADVHVLAVDQRGHGLTDLPIDRRLDGSWADLCDDLRIMLSGLGRRPALLAGHSMGATVSLMAAATDMPADRLLLFDPVWPDHGNERPLAEAALRRRALFASREEAAARLRERGAFATWPDHALAAYLETGLRPCDEGYRLSCAPEWEASNFAAREKNFEEAIARIDIECHLLLAGNGTTWRPPAGVTLPACLEVEIVEGSTHFLPIERPALAAEALLRALRSPAR